MVDKSLDKTRSNLPARPSHTTRDDRGGESAHQSSASNSVRENYREASQITGPITVATEGPTEVEFRSVLTRRQRLKLALGILINFAFDLTFLVVLILPRHVPTNHGPFGRFDPMVDTIGFVLVGLIETLRIIQNATLWIFASMMRDPVPLTPEPNLRIAVLTTIVPSKEPVELVAETLRAMRSFEYDGTVDVWILDEGNDPRMRAIAATLGVHHFSRKDLPAYNRASGPFRAGRKSGNHNAWRDAHEDQYDLVAQMDPDHVPFPEFLTRTVGYFHDPDVAFVVAPQVYGNLLESFVTNGAADQSYVFHGVVQRGANALEAPLLIGTNHVYRPAAWQQIGGYQDSVIEDHLTSLHIHSTLNPETGNLWKGVYTPDVLSIGEGPRSWTDYFNQQYRWAFGIWEIILHHSPRIFRRMPLRRVASYMGLELFYPSVALQWLFGVVIAALYLDCGVSMIDIAATAWLCLWPPTVILQYTLFVSLRRFNLARHERNGIGLNGVLLTLACGPIYVLAGLWALFQRPYTYAVTAKSSLASADSWHTFRLHIALALSTLTMLAASVVWHHDHWAQRFWGIFIFLAASLPFVCCGTVAWLRRMSPQHLRQNRHTPYAPTTSDQLLTTGLLSDDAGGTDEV
jgi:cellulose synthase (UDP-forming)